MNLRLSCVVASAALVFLSTPAFAERKPVKGEPLFRADLSVGPGAYELHVDNSDDEDNTTYALSVGPRLGLNLGYGVSRLVRIGLGGSVAFSMNLADDQGIPNAEIKGWGRWTVGPSVGFRFGPDVPLELDVAVNFANFMALGDQALAGGFDLEAKHYGMTSTVLLLWRPGGAASAFALHAGLEGTWGLASTTPPSGTSATNAMFLQSLLLGVSFGL